MEDFVKNSKEWLKFDLEQQAHRKIDEAIKELNSLRPNQRPNSIQSEEGIYDYRCLKCGEDFWWGDSKGEIELMWCEVCKTKEIHQLNEAKGKLPPLFDPDKSYQLLKDEREKREEAVKRGHKLQLEVNRLNDKLKEAQAVNKRLVFEVGDTTMECMTCGEEFEAERKIVRVRKAYCEKHIPDELRDAQLVDFDDVPQFKPQRFAKDPESLERRSKSQRDRREREKAEPIKHECAYCGEPTNKLFCSEECRKGHERVVALEANPEPPKEFKRIVLPPAGVPKPTDLKYRLS